MILERESQQFVVPLVYAVVAWFLHVPWLEIEPLTLLCNQLSYPARAQTLKLHRFLLNIKKIVRYSYTVMDVPWSTRGISYLETDSVHYVSTCGWVPTLQAAFPPGTQSALFQSLSSRGLHLSALGCAAAARWVQSCIYFWTMSLSSTRDLPVTVRH